MYIIAFLIFWFMLGLFSYSMWCGHWKRKFDEVEAEFSRYILVEGLGFTILGPFMFVETLKWWNPEIDGMWI